MKRLLLIAAALTCLAVFSATAQAQQKGVQIVKTDYKGWPNCYRMTNGEIELIATQDVGPRIIRIGFVGADNIFGEMADQVGKTEHGCIRETKGGTEHRIHFGYGSNALVD